jgi:hypothetical protein
MERKDITAQQLIDFVHSSTPLTPENYPALEQLLGEPRENFLVGHSLRHVSKSVGKMQGLVETAEHGGKLDKEELKKKIFASSFSLCKLCAILGISGNELIDGVYQMAEEEGKNEQFRQEENKKQILGQ